MKEFNNPAFICENMVESKKKLNPQKRGQAFQKLITDSIIYYEIAGEILPNFWDRPMKFPLSDKKLIGDNWLMTTEGNYILLELKVVNSRTSISLDRIEEHQYENLRNITKFTYKGHKGWLIIWFKYGKENYGVYAIRGDYLEELYEHKKIQGIKSIFKEELDKKLITCKVLHPVYKLKVFKETDITTNKIKNYVNINKLF